MKDERGRQRDTKRNPTRETLVDRQLTEVITEQSLLLGKIANVQASIDSELDNYTPESNETLKLLAQEMSTLSAELERLNAKLE